jgi:hypothetical protein
MVITVELLGSLAQWFPKVGFIASLGRWDYQLQGGVAVGLSELTFRLFAI